MAASRSNVTLAYQSPFLDRDHFAATLGDFARALETAKPALFVWIGSDVELKLLRPRLRRGLPRLRVLGSDGMGRSNPDPDLFGGDLFVSNVDLTAVTSAPGAAGV